MNISIGGERRTLLDFVLFRLRCVYLNVREHDAPVSFVARRRANRSRTKGQPLKHHPPVRAEYAPLRWLDAVPVIPLVLGAVLLGLAPITPEPHLWQKLKLLALGRLTQPIDIFDLFMHGALPVLLVLKLVRQHRLSRRAPRSH